MEDYDRLLDRILADAPSPSTLFLLLSKMKQEGHSKRVIQECTRVLNIYPHDIEIRRLLAEAYFESGRISQAESEMNKVLKEIHKFATSYRLYAEILIRQKREKEALESLKLYLAHCPDDGEALHLLDTLGAKEDQAEPRREKESAGLPDIATPTLAELYFKQGQIPEAIAIYEKVIARNPGSESLRQRLHELQEMLDQTPVSKGSVPDRVLETKAKTISILDNWLTNIREKFGKGTTAGDSPA